MSQSPPDIHRIARESPELLVIEYQGRRYRWITCSTCARQFWAQHDWVVGRALRSQFQAAVSCSNRCRKKRAREVRNSYMRQFNARRRAKKAKH